MTTRDAAKRDLERLMGSLQSSEHTTGQELYAKMILMTVSGLKRRLSQADEVRTRYLGKSAQYLPAGLLRIAQEYLQGSIDLERATERITHAESLYRELFLAQGYHLDEEKQKSP